MPIARPSLVLAVHGSAHPAYRAAIEAIRSAVVAADAVDAEGGAANDVRLGWLDHEQPDLATAAAAAGAAGPAGGPVVVVPLLLAAGFHARVDIPRMLATVAGTVVTRPIGPDPLLARALVRQAAEAGATGESALVVAAAGSSDPRALADVEEVVAMLDRHHPGPVVAGYLSGTGSRLDTEVHRLVLAGHDVIVLTYLICPGRLADTVAATALTAGARTVGPPIGSCSEITELIGARWREATGF